MLTYIRKTCCWQQSTRLLFLHHFQVITHYQLRLSISSIDQLSSDYECYSHLSREKIILQNDFKRLESFSCTAELCLHPTFWHLTYTHTHAHTHTHAYAHEHFSLEYTHPRTLHLLTTHTHTHVQFPAFSLYGRGKREVKKRSLVSISPIFYVRLFSYESFVHRFFVQWKPLYVITLGLTESDNINRMITITGCFHIVSFSKWEFEMWSH